MYIEFPYVVNIVNFQQKMLNIFFLFLLQIIDCWYSLEPPYLGSSNEYPKSTFWSKNKKNMYTPVYSVSLYLLYPNVEGLQRLLTRASDRITIIILKMQSMHQTLPY